MNLTIKLTGALCASGALWEENDGFSERKAT